jgi:hypothetical protein
LGFRIKKGKIMFEFKFGKKDVAKHNLDIDAGKPVEEIPEVDALELRKEDFEGKIKEVKGKRAKIKEEEIRKGENGKEEKTEIDWDNLQGTKQELLRLPENELPYHHEIAYHIIHDRDANMIEINLDKGEYMENCLQRANNINLIGFSKKAIEEEIKKADAFL